MAANERLLGSYLRQVLATGCRSLVFFSPSKCRMVTRENTNPSAILIWGFYFSPFPNKSDRSSFCFSGDVLRVVAKVAEQFVLGISHLSYCWGPGPWKSCAIFMYACMLCILTLPVPIFQDLGIFHLFPLKGVVIAYHKVKWQIVMMSEWESREQRLEGFIWPCNKSLR